MLGRLILFVSGFLLAALLGIFIIQYAKGLRFDIDKLSFKQTGILVATSNPDGAEVLINGKLMTATNQTIDLIPDTFDIEILKEGYFPWKKRLTIESSAVTKTDALLFPKAPSLSPITFDGVEKPFMSPDGTKLVWIIPESPEANSKAGLWILELTNLPFGFARNARQITDASIADAQLTWSPDGRTILTEKSNSAFLLETGTFTKQGNLISQPQTKVAQIKASWEKEKKKEMASRLQKLPEPLRDIIEAKSIQFAFSPDETKVAYTADIEFTIPDKLTDPLPGSSTQKQERTIKKGQTYIYDIKEDRNFLIANNSESLIINHQSIINNFNNPAKRKLTWLPSSRHLILAESDKITILEYDGTNRINIWSAAYVAPFAFASPSGNQLMILTSLGAADNRANLYTINLK